MDTTNNVQDFDINKISKQDDIKNRLDSFHPQKGNLRESER